MIAASTVGTWHNEGLRWIAIVRFNKLMDQAVASMVNRGCKQEDVDAVRNKLENDGIIEWIALHPQFSRQYPTIDAQDFFNAAADSFNKLTAASLSKSFQSAVTSILKGIPSITSVSQFVKDADTALDTVTDQNELQYAQIARSILHSSSSYWTDGVVGTPAMLSGWTIAGDVVGGILGGIGGGLLGAIVLGVAMSVLVDNYEPF